MIQIPSALLRVSSKKYLCIAILLSLAAVSSIQAEDRTGRLPDGRAFRTDPAGNQLVDYIAELELNNSMLRQQVSGLETELAQKQAMIDNAKNAGITVTSALKEKDILKHAPVAAPQAASCPSCKACPACMPLDCSREISQARLEVEEDMRRVSIESSVQQQQKEQELSKLRLQTQALQGQLAEMQRVPVSNIQESAKRDIAMARNDAALAKKDADSLREVLVKKDADSMEQQQQLLAQLESLQQENTALKGEKEGLKKVQAELESRMASMQAMPAPAPALEVREVKASYNTSRSGSTRDAALDSLRGKISTNMNQIQGLIATRDRLYADYARGGHAVSFRPAKPVASSGNSLQAIRTAADQAITVRELSLLIRDVNEIRSKVEFDIGMMERMKRLR